MDRLDDACLFELLVRLNYQDLVNLCKVYNKLYKISMTPHFQECWKKHNITKVETETSIKHFDKSNKLHGKFIVKNSNDGIREETDYVQDLLHGKSIIYIYGLKRKVKTYVGNFQHGLTICYLGDYESPRYDDPFLTHHQSFYNGKQHGLTRTYNLNGEHAFIQYKHNILHGKCFNWWPNGGLKTIATYSQGINKYRRIDIDENGRKRRDYGRHNNQLDGSYKTWNADGEMTGDHVYLNGIRIV